MGFFKKSSYYYTQKNEKFVKFCVLFSKNVIRTNLLRIELFIPSETVKKDPLADTQVNITSANTEQAVSVNTEATIEALRKELLGVSVTETSTKDDTDSKIMFWEHLMPHNGVILYMWDYDLTGGFLINFIDKSYHSTLSNGFSHICSHL